MPTDVLPVEISAEEVVLLQKDSYFLIDVREKWEKAIADIGGQLIPFHSLPSIEKIPELKSKRLVVYCHHGVRSFYAVTYLREQGFNLAQSLKGGIDEWAKNIDPKLAKY